MGAVFGFLGLSTVPWAMLFARRASAWTVCAIFVALGYVLGPPLLSVKIGPVTFTAERLLLVVLLGKLLLLAWERKLSLRFVTELDWVLAATVGYLTLRCLTTPAPPEFGGSDAGPWWRLIAAFWIPAVLYFAARTALLDERAWRTLLVGLAALGAYLTFTSFAEIGKQWWAVFPRYIADPTLGTHFGRARGPLLNSASLGVMLTACFWAVWFLAAPLARRGQALALLLLLAIAAAVYFTYTRSTWIGLGLTCGLVPLLQMPRRMRYVAALGVVFAGAVGVVLFGEVVTKLGRKDSDASAEHSVYQRASFAYVSARMFRDAPVFGCGLGRFYDCKLPYLADRSQQIELESLRSLDHHNTLLSILVETGLVGLTLYLLLLAGWAKAGLTLFRDASLPAWQRRQGLFTLAILANYLSSALFHDLTLLPTEHWILFLAGGTSAALVAERRRAGAVDVQRSPSRVSQFHQASSRPLGSPAR
jgi:O-antigen ligase